MLPQAPAAKTQTRPSTPSAKDFSPARHPSPALFLPQTGGHDSNPSHPSTLDLQLLGTKISNSAPQSRSPTCSSPMTGSSLPLVSRRTYATVVPSLYTANHAHHPDMNRDPFIAWELDIGSGYNHLRLKQCRAVKLVKQHTTILPLTRHLKSYVSSITSHRELPLTMLLHSSQPCRRSCLRFTGGKPFIGFHRICPLSLDWNLNHD
ncbi:hypothetical protein L1887_30154 [Cichorium endivia]|nr:hypothetical protein L1887_30154 [Cichorium endivia]